MKLSLSSQIAIKHITFSWHFRNGSVVHCWILLVDISEKIVRMWDINAHKSSFLKCLATVSCKRETHLSLTFPTTSYQKQLKLRCVQSICMCCYLRNYQRYKSNMTFYNKLQPLKSEPMSERQDECVSSHYRDKTSWVQVFVCKPGQLIPWHDCNGSVIITWLTKTNANTYTHTHTINKESEE